MTLFGVFLTPVFFFTINRLGESRLFSSHFVQATGALALDVLRLGSVWRLHRPVRATVAPRPGKVFHGRTVGTDQRVRSSEY